LTEETTPEGIVSYTYDTAGRRTTMTVAGQTVVDYSYDNADRLSGVTQGTASVGMTHDNANRRTSLTLPNGILVEYAYDDDSRLTGLTYKQGGSTLGDLTYTYDAAGQRTNVGGSYARTGLPAALASATYDDANQIATFGGVSFTYDANGNLTSDGVRSYTRDCARLFDGGSFSVRLSPRVWSPLVYHEQRRSRRFNFQQLSGYPHNGANSRYGGPTKPNPLRPRREQSCDVDPEESTAV
jgi:YD repeat-containing protein